MVLMHVGTIYCHLETTIDSLDPSFKKFEPTHQPKDFPFDIRSGIENWLLVPENLRHRTGYATNKYSDHKIQNNNPHINGIGDLYLAIEKVT